MNTVILFFTFLLSLLVALIVVKVGEFWQKRISFLHDPVYVPSKDDAVERMLKLAAPKKGEIILDLGSGDGKLVAAFADKGYQTIGYEIDPFLVRESRKTIARKVLENKATILWKSFWRADVSKADIVLLFMTARIMERLEQKLRRELKPGAKVVSQRFVFPNWKPVKQLDDCYLYIQK